jgi:hypothetical protein
MDQQIPRYKDKVQDARITVYVTRELKNLWDRLSRNEGVRVGQVTRDFLLKTLPEIEREIKASKP